MGKLVRLDSIADMRAAAADWDDLWRRSDVTIPTFRAEMLAQWLEQFAPEAAFRVLVVEDHGRWVAAIPLVDRKHAGLLAAAMPSNEWASGGELLLDADTDTDGVLDELVAAIRRLPHQLLWIDEVAVDAPRWRALRRALDRAAVPVDCRRQYRVARIEIDGDWEACKRRWSRKHRQQMAASSRKLAAEGEVRCQILSELTPVQVEPCLRRAFELEDRGWKGKAGSSVLKTPGLFDFFLRQALQLAQWEQLELCLLELDEQPIAFAYGFNAKQVFHSVKVGYDPRFAVYRPGQLLRYAMLERFYGESDRRALDCMGPLTEAHASWKPASYTIGRLAIAPRRLTGRLAVFALRHWLPLVRRRGVEACSAEAIRD